MVRVGGGWVALDEFLQKNDPCRGKCRKIIHILIESIKITISSKISTNKKNILTLVTNF